MHCRSLSTESSNYKLVHGQRCFVCDFPQQMRCYDNFWPAITPRPSLRPFFWRMCTGRIRLRSHLGFRAFRRVTARYEVFFDKQFPRMEEHVCWVGFIKQ
ncbi:hypothetical protein BJX63DRAFT_127340 [Aspergillus granulosus]|uniref:Uncharacterized protein n=1 Tax=Aspergillus granulosus TaxID=176169 RepID=A0ABR4I4I2_9EURO